MPEYCIEVRLSGYAKEYTRRLLYGAGRRFGLSGASKNAPPTRVIVYGPFRCGEPRRMADAVAEACLGFDVVSYRLKGFENYEVARKWLFGQGFRGVFIDVEPSDNLRLIRGRLRQRLSGFCHVSPGYDSPDIRFSAPIDLAGADSKFDRVLAYLKENEERDLSQRVIRLTVSRDGEVYCEYDFMEHKLVRAQPERPRSRYLDRTFAVLRKTNEEAFQPIWFLAGKAAALGRRPRQLTLVEDDPAARLPRIFGLAGIRMHYPKRLGGRSRQVTLSGDNGFPKITGLVSSHRKKAAARRAGAGRQATIEADPERARVSGFIAALKERARRQAGGLIPS